MFTENDCVRIVCKVLHQGDTSMPQLTARIKKECPDVARTPEDEEVADEISVAAEAAESLLRSNEVFDEAFILFRIVNGILNVLSIAAGLLPGPLRLVRIPAAAARIQIATVMTRIVQRRAANDEHYRLFQLIERARRKVA